MPCLTLFSSRSKKSAPLRQIITNEFELAYSIRESSIAAINDMDLKRREAVWLMGRSVTSSWSSIQYEMKPKVKTEGEVFIEFTGPNDVAVKLLDRMSHIVRDVRKNAVLIDQLSREIAKIEILALSNNGISTERKNFCEEQITQLMPKLSEDVYMFMHFDEQLKRFEYGNTLFKIQGANENAMVEKYSALYAALRDAELAQEDAIPAAVVENSPKDGAGLNLNM